LVIGEDNKIAKIAITVGIYIRIYTNKDSIDSKVPVAKPINK
jgi:hypothetical protein